MIHAQFRGVVDKDMEQFRHPGRQVILWPEQYRIGEAIVPFEKARGK